MKYLCLEEMGMVSVQEIYARAKRVVLGIGVGVLETVGQEIFVAKWEMDTVELGSVAERKESGGEKKASGAVGKESVDEEESVFVLINTKEILLETL